MGTSTMLFSVTEHFVKISRHASFYLASGPEAGPLIIFVHGWPELSHSWRHALRCFGALGFRCVAPDMRGYGRSSNYSSHAHYALEHSVDDMMELLAHLGRERALWIGYDWGSPVVWSLASHYPDRCEAIANLCVPYIADGFAPGNLIALVNREIYPEATYPAVQWEYQIFYKAQFERARSTFEADIENTIRALFRKDNPAGHGKPSRATASPRCRCAN
jgi:pimeloyl-ACP methyl ester carboxylesterase